MLTQIVDKAPKWSFTGRPKDAVDQATTAGPIAVKTSCKYQRDPTYSFGPPGGPDSGGLDGSKGYGRPGSAPPGPLYTPLAPTTPHYSFGTTKRGCPFPDVNNSVSPGPSAFSDPRYSRGPKFSMEPRRSSSRRSDGPGPGGFVPKRSSGATFAPHWGKPKPRDGDADARSRSLGGYGSGGAHDLGGGGGTGGPYAFGQGPSYSMGARRGMENGIGDGGGGGGGAKGTNGKLATRELGPNFSHFGYNDFGRASH